LRMVQPDCALQIPSAWHVKAAAVPLYPVAQDMEYVEP